jgi:predicted dehydrogenase
MNVAIIGCGLIGQKRAKILANLNCCLVACVDHVLEKATALAKSHTDCLAFSDWRAVMTLSSVNIVIISTLHASLAEITLAAVAQGKHVLIEKPAGRCASEIVAVIEMAKKTGSLVRVGFNHRYHRAFRQARKLIDEGAIGELMFLRARYGHGGRVGYDQEWRANPTLSGGGELIDQGVHLIDLARWFLGDFSEIDGYAHTYFWNMPVDDNGFLLLKTPKKQVAFLHASCTEWKNTFSFEIYGKIGKLEIQGLGGSYGVERLAFYKMSPQMGPPETTIWEYPMADDSWEFEMAEFMEDIRLNRQPSANLNDAKSALEIVETIYKNSGYQF